MSFRTLVEVLVYAAAGGLLALVGTYLLGSRVPERLIRVNVNEKRVPAILGLPIAAAGLGCALVAIALRPSDVGWAVPAVVVTLAVAGLWDDLRGHELPRGFSGHLSAARGGRVTGGIVKLVAGAACGLVAGSIVTEGRGVLEVALLVALTANLINLFDRAPGRAGKVALAVGLPLVAFGPGGWAVVAAGILGGLVVLLPADLGERAMLGDAGANPVGGIVGLGLAVSLPSTGRWIAIGVLLALNVLSERVSFSRVIENNGLLRRMDMLGRRREREAS